MMTVEDVTRVCALAGLTPKLFLTLKRQADRPTRKKSAVGKQTHRKGQKLARPASSFLPEEIESIRSEYEAGQPVTAIARNHKSSEAVIRGVMKRHGIEANRSKGQVRRRVEDMLTAGHGPQAISEMTGCNVQYAFRIAQECYGGQR